MLDEELTFLILAPSVIELLCLPIEPRDLFLSSTDIFTESRGGSLPDRPSTLGNLIYVNRVNTSFV